MINYLAYHLKSDEGVTNGSTHVAKALALVGIGAAATIATVAPIVYNNGLKDGSKAASNAMMNGVEITPDFYKEIGKHGVKPRKAGLM